MSDLERVQPLVDWWRIVMTELVNEPELTGSETDVLGHLVLLLMGSPNERWAVAQAADAQFSPEAYASLAAMMVFNLARAGVDLPASPLSVEGVAAIDDQLKAPKARNTLQNDIVIFVPGPTQIQ